jgi:hypothetical protein
MKKYLFAFLVTFFLPALAIAATCSGNTSVNLNSGSTSMFSDVVCYVIYLISLLIPILFALTFIFFFWGLSKYVIGADDKTLKQGKEYMMWGILVLFILTSYMAIIGMATSELDFSAPSTTGSLLP